MNIQSVATSCTSITLIRPDDWHLHLRDGVTLAAVLPHTAKRFARAIVMPNLKPPVINTAQALAYRERILAAITPEANFTPLMTLYLTSDLTPATILNAAASGFIYAVKLYPTGVTTNSEAGIKNLEQIYPVLETLQTIDMPLLIHAETPDPEVDIFDRERVFIERHVSEIARHFPALRIVIEHITTKEAVQFVTEANPNIGATITAHHLLYNRNALLTGCLRPHFYCLPILKREHHRQALIAAAISGNSQFFLGTDSAPHAVDSKECSCGCAGCFTAHAAIELYAEVFEQAGALDRLEAFASFHGADFYKLPRNQDYIRLVKKPWQVPHSYSLGNNQYITPLRAGETLAWQVVI